MVATEQARRLVEDLVPRDSPVAVPYGSFECSGGITTARGNPATLILNNPILRHGPSPSRPVGVVTLRRSRTTTMHRNQNNRSLLILLTIGLSFLLLPNIGAACALGPRPTVLQAYKKADVVVIARAVSQEKTNDPSPPTGNRVLSTTMEIEKVFKGNLRVRDKITFGQGNSPGCTWDFYEDAIGQEYLFYLYSPTDDSKLWYEFGYSRSHLLPYVADDLLYLNNLDAVRGKTRVSGTLDQEEDEPDVVGKKIWIMGKDKVYETTTDQNGVYEFYDLPPGRYLLEPELPAGWRIDRDTRGTTTISDPKRQILGRHIAFTLRPRQHAAIDVSFVLDNVVSGRVVDSRGNPLRGVQVSLKPTDAGHQSVNFEYTDEEGGFAIESIEPGTYVLVLNKDGEKRIEEPFPALYYPSVAEEAKARVFRIRPGDNMKGLTIVVPHVEEMVTVQGVVRLADGTPAPRSTVRFIPAKVPGVDGSAVEDTDTKGQFSFKTFKGVPGEVHADFFAYSGNTARVLGRYNYENCPQVQMLVKQTGKEMIKTPALRIDPKHDIHNLVLTFPFRACK